MSASHFMGINQIIIEIFCSGLKCWTDRPANIAIPGNTLLMWQLLDAKQPNKKSNLTLALQSLITLFVIQFSPHLCGSFSRRSYMSLNIKTVLQVADEEERINVWLKPTQITWYLFEMITSALGIDGFCAVWPFDCTDMWYVRPRLIYISNYFTTLGFVFVFLTFQRFIGLLALLAAPN